MTSPYEHEKNCIGVDILQGMASSVHYMQVRQITDLYPEKNTVLSQKVTILHTIKK